MNTLDPVYDFHLPGPAAREPEDEGEFPEIRSPHWDDEADVDEIPESTDESFTVDDDSVGGHDADGGFDAGDEDENATAPEQEAGPGAPAAREQPAPATDRRGSVLALLLLSGAMMAGGWYLAQPETLPIKQVHIEGEFRELSRTEMQALVADNLRGGFFSLDVTALRQAVSIEPWVRAVEVQRIWPDAIRVSVREQTALASWHDGGLVSSNGDHFQPSTVVQAEGLPQLAGPAGMQEHLADRLQQLQQALQPLGLEVQILRLSERRAWSFETRGGLRVMLGRAEFDSRLARFLELVPGSLGERLAEAAYIDMRYTNGFAVRFNEDGDSSSKPATGANEGNGAA